MTSRLFITATLCLGTALIGCATDESHTTNCINCDEDGKADGTNPTAGSGFLTLATVINDTPDVQFMVRRLSSAHEHQVPAGQPVEVSAGKYCVWTRVSGFDTVSDCTIAIEDRADVTVPLGAVLFEHPAAVFGIDTTPLATPPVGHLLSHVAPVSHVAGDFTYGFGNNLVKLRIRAGEQSVIDFSAAGPEHSRIRLLPPPLRELPSAQPTLLQICSGRGGFASCEPYFVADKPIAFFTSFPDEAVVYAWNRVAIDEVAYPAAGFTLDVQLRRIDLNHVRVTTSSGVQLVPGSANIERFDGVAFRSMIDVQPTGAGLDVLPGKYQVTTTFVHPVDGELMQVSEILDLR